MSGGFQLMDLAEFSRRRMTYLDQGAQSFLVEVPRRCGHIQAMQLPLSTAPNTMEHFTTTSCSGCDEALKEAFRERIEHAGRRAVALKLPPLLGVSVRQIDYATCCRDKALERHGQKAIAVALQSQTDAKWWIDNRHRTVYLKVFRELEEARG